MSIGAQSPLVGSRPALSANGIQWELILSAELEQAAADLHGDAVRVTGEFVVLGEADGGPQLGVRVVDIGAFAGF